MGLGLRLVVRLTEDEVLTARIEAEEDRRREPVEPEVPTLRR